MKTFERTRCRFVIIMLMSLFLVSCAEWTSPACRGYYTKKGNSEAISELIEEYTDAIDLASSEDNFILLSRVSSIGTNLVAMEEWTCKVHKTLGRP